MRALRESVRASHAYRELLAGNVRRRVPTTMRRSERSRATHKVIVHTTEGVERGKVLSAYRPPTLNKMELEAD